MALAAAAEFRARAVWCDRTAPQAAAASRKHIVNDVGVLRRDGEVKSYIDLLFLALVVVLCVSKIVTD